MVAKWELTGLAEKMIESMVAKWEPQQINNQS